MKAFFTKWLCIVALFQLIFTSSFAQVIKKIEYFWDTDPGIGLAIPITIAIPLDSIFYSNAISTNGLSVGSHTLFFRSCDFIDRWSIAEGRTITVTPTIIAAEYFWDTDPGIGLGIALPVSGTPSDSVYISSFISTTSLLPGNHILFTRTKDVEGRWSIAEGRTVTVTPTIIATEYFWDTDPGVGLATAIAVTGTPSDSVYISSSISTTSLSIGSHILFTRTKDVEGRWSIAEGRTVTVTPTIVAAEYFWDTDPGVGLATAIAVTGTPSDSVFISSSISTALLLPGSHILYSRTKDVEGRWSIAEGRAVTVTPTIVAAEYFWDTDPGIGLATAIAVTGTPSDSVYISSSIPTTSLSTGSHILYTRTKDVDGRWSIAEGRTVTVTPTIVAAEYFWDTDPGVGLATAIAVTGTPSDSVYISSSIPTTSLSTGSHILYSRTKDVDGRWSIAEGRSVTVTPTIVAAEYFWDTDPGIGLATSIAVTGTPSDSVYISSSIPTTSLSTGSHILFTRTKDVDGRWSIAEGRSITIYPVIIAAEYFVDTDPGVGNATAITILSSDSINTNFNVPTIGLNFGLHYVYTRTMDSEKKWSIAEGRSFYVGSCSSIIIASGATTFCNGGSVVLTSSAGKNYLWSNGQTTGSITVTSSGNYFVTVTDFNGCSSISNSIAVTVQNNLPVSVSIAANPGTNVCNGTSVTFTATPINGGTTPSYQWKVNGVNAGTNSPTYTNSSLTNGNTITCTVTSNEACATNNPSVSNTLTMTISAPVTPSVAISWTPFPACTGTPITTTANPTNGGSNPTYQWFVNNVLQQSGSSNQFISSTIANNAAVKCTMISSLSCVTTSTVTSSTLTASISQYPVISSFSPLSGNVGTTVVITGSQFAGITAVKFNGITATYVVNSTTQITATVPTGATSGFITINRSTIPCIGTSNSAFTVTTPTITLNLKVYLQGFFKAINIQEPVLYNSGITPNNAICDTIVVELHQSTSPYALVNSQSTLLNVNGTCSIIYPNSLNGNYYIVIKHRSSIETWSKVPLLFNSSIVSYDFTTP